MIKGTPFIDRYWQIIFSIILVFCYDYEICVISATIDHIQYACIYVYADSADRSYIIIFKLWFSILVSCGRTKAD